MKITLEQEVHPFQVPNYVLVRMPPSRRQDGFLADPPKYRLGDLADETLEMLCARFKHDVFARAREQRATPDAAQGIPQQEKP